jgi:hypothetical protein
MMWIRVSVLILAATLLVWRTVESVELGASLRLRAAAFRQAATTEKRAVELPALVDAARLYVTKDGDTATPGQARQILAIFVGARSNKSRDSIGPWSQLLGQLPWRPDQEVWVVADTWHADASVLTAAATRSGARVRELVIRDPVDFSRVTGMGSVPSALLVLDGRLQLMSIGPIVPEDIQPFGEYLETIRPRYPEHPFLTDRLPDPIGSDSQTASAGGTEE